MKKRLGIHRNVRINGKATDKTDLTGQDGYILHFAGYKDNLPTTAVVVVGSVIVRRDDGVPLGRRGGTRHEVALDQLEVV
jgi:hypothetical protein